MQAIKTSSSDLPEAHTRVLHYFFDYPNKEFTLNELSSRVNISKSTAKRIVEQLIKDGFLNREILGKLWRISCNQHHRFNTTKKIVYHLGLIYESGIIEKIHEIVPNARTVVLFGSYRKGDDVETSDIDIAAEVIGKQEYKLIELDPLPSFGYRKNVHLTVHVFSRKDTPLNLFANIANGIILEGFLEVRPCE